MSLPTLPGLPWPPQFASIGAMIVGALGAILTMLGVSVTTATALQSIVQLLISAAILIAGLAAHTHLHSQHLAAVTALTPTQAPSASSGGVVAPTLPVTPVAPAVVPPVADTPLQVMPVIPGPSAT